MDNTAQITTEKPIEGEVVKNTQNFTPVKVEFKPTPHMYRWLEKAIELGHGASITEISKNSKVERRNWYIWIRNPNFVNWWDTQWKQHLMINRWKLNAIGMKNAESDYTYWKDMMMVTGNMQPEGPAIVNPTQVNVNLDKYIK